MPGVAIGSTNGVDGGPGFLSSYERAFPTKADADMERYSRAKVVDFNFHAVGELMAIHMERPFRGLVERCQITGDYDVGVGLFFALYGEIRQCMVQGPKIGYLVGNGLAIPPTPWPDATNSNSQSNLALVEACRFGGMDASHIGFILDGGAGVSFKRCAVEGQLAAVGWDLQPRAARCKTSLVDCWIECPLDVAIRFRSTNSLLVIDGLDIDASFIPAVLLDAIADNGSRVRVQNCSWPTVPPLRVGRKTQVEYGPGNSFGQDDLAAAIDRA